MIKSNIDIPSYWYNFLNDLPLNGPLEKDYIDDAGSRIEMINKIRLDELKKQDICKDREIPIPKEVLKKYEEIGRPTPLMRAKKLEEYLDTPAKIYIKREDLLPTHSFKLNSAIAQVYYASVEGVGGVVSETGAGQWGLALAFASQMFNIKCKIFWVKVSRKQKPLRSAWAQMLGAEILDSPSDLTITGRTILRKNPDCHGSLGISIGEAISYCLDNDYYKYVSGSNIPHVLMHQTVIGLETKEQFKMLGEFPDILVACCGGGSNLGGFIGPFLNEKKQNNNLRLVAAESAAAPRLTKGKYIFDHADPLGYTPLTLSYSLGKDFMPPPVHVGGLRQHNGSPVIGVILHNKLMEAYAYNQNEIFECGKLFTKLYGIIPAPETCHALKATIDIALEARKNNQKKTIAMCFSGNGILDINGYQQ